MVCCVSVVELGTNDAWLVVLTPTPSCSGDSPSGSSHESRGWASSQLQLERGGDAVMVALRCEVAAVASPEVTSVSPEVVKCLQRKNTNTEVQVVLYSHGV